MQRELVKMRREGLIPWGWITDGSRSVFGHRRYGDPDSYARQAAGNYRKDYWLDSAEYVEVWLEKEALKGVVSPAVQHADKPRWRPRGGSSRVTRRPRYVRLGGLFGGGLSRNARTGEHHAGVSVYPGLMDDDEPDLFRIDTTGLNDSGCAILILMAADDRPAYFVWGEKVGRGPEGEPLVRPERVAPVPKTTAHDLHPSTEGNTLSEEQVRSRLEGKPDLPPSQEYMGREVDNVIRAVNLVAKRTLASDSTDISVEEIKEYNRIVLDGLELDDWVVPGEIRDRSVGVGRCRAAPAKDCEYLLERRVRELIEERDCELLYLPPHSPDLNPIEEAFAKLKALLRRAGVRTREALIKAMGRALDAVTASDARGFFEHRGYRATAQLP